MKRFTILLCMSLVALISRAQGGATLVLWHADGTTTEVQLNTKPKVEFQGDSVRFTSTIYDMRYHKNDILRFSYKGVPNSFEMGDVNHDKNVDVADVMLMVKYAMHKTPPVFFIQNADVNGDGRYDVADVMGIVRISLSKNAQVPDRVMVRDEGLFLSSQGNSFLLSMDDASTFTAFQAEIIIPNGCKLTGLELCKGSETSHQVSYKDMGNGRYNLMVFSLEDRTFNNDGNLVRFNIKGSPTGEIKMEKALFTNTECEITYFKSPQIATSIDDIDIDGEEHPYYNLEGVKTTVPTRGVYIQNGKKKAIK